MYNCFACLADVFTKFVLHYCVLFLLAMCPVLKYLCSQCGSCEICFIIYLSSADAELLAECSIEGLEREYQKYNILSTEDLTRHFIAIQFYTTR